MSWTSPLLSNSSAPQFCANLSGMMTNCAKLHYSFTSTAWIWCKTMPDCAKGRRLDVGIWCKTVPDCANERWLDVESTDVLDITLWQNKQQLSGFHYSEKSNDKKYHWPGNFSELEKLPGHTWRPRWFDFEHNSSKMTSKVAPSEKFLPNLTELRHRIALSLFQNSYYKFPYTWIFYTDSFM